MIGQDSDMLRDAMGAFATRYNCAPGSAYLLRPDGYVAARFKRPNGTQIADALRRASGWQ
jgi:3-(3-hydroxy-phenyl)propionate hydroxylase